MTTKMTSKQHEKIIKLISVQTCTDANATDHLYDNLGFDPLDMLELCVELETTFNIDILDEEVEGWRTVADVVRSVETRL